MNVLVTGAANGIGAAVVARAVRDGHRVVAADADRGALESRYAGNAAVRTTVLDVRDDAAWRALVAGLDADGVPLDVLVNVAGVLRSGETGELRAEDVALTLDVNVKGVILGANAVAESMKRRGRGHIVNVGSVASLFPTPGTTVYAASKYAVRGFSIAAAGDLAQYGIAVTLVGPGPVKTGMLEQQRGDRHAALTFSSERALTPDEVAAAILGPVLAKRPLEFFLPFKDHVLGKISTLFPRFFLSQLDKARIRGTKNFASPGFR